MLDSFEINKIVGAVLFTVLVLLGLGLLTDFIFDREPPEQMGYLIEVPEESAAVETPAVEMATMSLAEMLASGDMAAGATVARKCAACHTFDNGGTNKVGPNLYGILGRVIASAPGFSYSDALKGNAGTWNFENLSAFLANPREAVPGTSMGFAGVSRDNQRADLLLYLQSISPDAPPLPQ